MDKLKMTDVEQILLNRVKLIGDGEWTLIGTPQELIDEINRLIVKGRLERGIYELERLEHDPQMFGDWEKVVEERIHLLETELLALSNNLSKGEQK